MTARFSFRLEQSKFDLWDLYIVSDHFRLPRFRNGLVFFSDDKEFDDSTARDGVTGEADEDVVLDWIDEELVPDLRLMGLSEAQTDDVVRSINFRVLADEYFDREAVAYRRFCARAEAA